MKGRRSYRFSSPVGGPAFFAFINSSSVGFFPGPTPLLDPTIPTGLDIGEGFFAGKGLLLPAPEVELTSD